MNAPRPPPPWIVVIAASAGGLLALEKVLGALPADFPVPIAVVQHRTSNPPNLLDKVLSRRTSLRVKEAAEGEKLLPGTVYLAPPDRHLLLGHDGVCHLFSGAKISHVRSSANPLFASAADTFGERGVGVVLTGGGRDGADGVQSIKRRGGIVIAQDEATSQVFAMPRSAIETGCVDRVLPVEEIGPALIQLVKTGWF